MHYCSCPVYVLTLLVALCLLNPRSVAAEEISIALLDLPHPKLQKPLRLSVFGVRLDFVGKSAVVEPASEQSDVIADPAMNFCGPYVVHRTLNGRAFAVRSRIALDKNRRYTKLANEPKVGLRDLASLQDHLSYPYLSTAGKITYYLPTVPVEILSVRYNQAPRREDSVLSYSLLKASGGWGEVFVRLTAETESNVNGLTLNLLYAGLHGYTRSVEMANTHGQRQILASHQEEQIKIVMTSDRAMKWLRGQEAQVLSRQMPGVEEPNQALQAQLESVSKITK